MDCARRWHRRSATAGVGDRLTGHRALLVRPGNGAP